MVLRYETIKRLAPSFNKEHVGRFKHNALDLVVGCSEKIFFFAKMTKSKAMA